MAQRQLIINLPSQTGDTAHVAGALAIDPNVDVIVLYKDNIAPNDLLLEVYRRAAGYQEGRVKSFSPLAVGGSSDDARKLYNKLAPSDENSKESSSLLNPTSSEYRDITKLGAYVANFMNNNLRYNNGNSSYHRLSVVGASYLVAQRFHEQKDKAVLYNRLAERLSYDPAILSSNDIIQGGKFGDVSLPKPSDKTILLLWARYTGQNSPTGYNPEGDSDVVGQGQLLNLAKGLDLEVITIGHDPASHRNETGVHADYHLGEFYQNGLLTGKNRAAQVSFFLAMMQRYPGKLIQIGQKTGGMDAAALVGIPTVYIEDKRSPTTERMERWTETVPYYRRALVEDPPTSLGKALRRLNLAFEAEDKKRAEELQKDLSSAHRHNIAFIYACWTKLEDIEKVVYDPEPIVVTLYKAATPHKIEEWMTKIKGFDKAQLEKYGVSRGYIDIDQFTIKTALEFLLKMYGVDGDAIIRTTSYLRRAELKTTA
ncbi:hypothetical protein CPB86DRAFT_848840 [Serendipita vermifera]|nr:hypothetical protein CPB86DRAFT_848840 [Serendipita vermifera]